MALDHFDVRLHKIDLPTYNFATEKARVILAEYFLCEVAEEKPETDRRDDLIRLVYAFAYQRTRFLRHERFFQRGELVFERRDVHIDPVISVEDPYLANAWRVKSC